MANDTVKSATLTDLDAIPIANVNAGQGLGGRLVEVDDFCTATAAGTACSAWPRPATLTARCRCCRC